MFGNNKSERKHIEEKMGPKIDTRGAAHISRAAAELCLFIWTGKYELIRVFIREGDSQQHGSKKNK